ncbi:hybrid sensor histidine kinase/response regulator [Pseudomonas sp. HMWF010]|nr:hybrid sensor histidine kinase/response regulator [Caulobacter sp. HMWF009]PTT13168.1 hybrid sensor histidine kinase/response regulator [Caulobacter sp. HMWF025]PTT76839.1 hybrid sensor histidine kinase/response regulator [Pseudomonas sp. HMWF010]
MDGDPRIVLRCKRLFQIVQEPQILNPVSGAQGWTAIIEHRRRDLLTIVPMTLLAAAGSAIWLGPAPPLTWLGLVSVLILANAALCTWIGFRSPASWHEALMTGFTLVYTGLYCLLPTTLILYGSLTSVLAGAAMLGAIALSSTAEFVLSRRIGGASFVALLLVILVCGGTAAGTARFGQTLVAMIGALSFLAYVFQYAVHRERAEREMVAALALARDKEAEAAAANQAKTIFLATMSHEIRTPLNGVLGMVQVMERDALTDSQRERLKIVRESGEALKSILNDVLDLSRIEAGRLELDAVPFDLVSLLTSSQQTFAMQAAQKALEQRLAIAADAAGVYRGDPGRLRQVVHNLLSNALKFTGSGSVTLAAEAVPGGLRISVSDTGPGFTSDQYDKLFSRFVQLDASTTRVHGGAGLGLAICRDLCGLMGGSISVDSQPGQGATFTIEIPLERLAGQDVPPDLDQAVRAKSGHRKLRVLAAEDNPTNQRVLTAIFEVSGVDLLVVDDGAKAVEAWRAQPWDAILMDIHMPVMDGLAALAEIRRSEAELGRPRTPVIALTANAMSHQVADLLAAGMDDHVAKPIDVGQLLMALDKV